MPRKKKVEEVEPTPTTSCDEKVEKKKEDTIYSPYGKKALTESAKFTIK